ncbi:fimbrial protein, partial [Scandinavium sp. NPDC088450]|uniref:fimbrial protein n=1 Tax=Scandinavium sp. NPDC088450 TaxID=3364514 RepID=UPI003850E808
LVKIAATTGSGPMTGGSIVKAQVVGESDIMNVILGGGTVRTVGCSVSNTTINVPMGLTRNIDFSGPGSTGNDNTFDIALDCTAGTRVSMRLDPGSAGLADASNGVLNLNGGSGAQASGVGIQVLYNDAPVQFGTAMSAGTSRGGFTDLLLKARYYQTGSKVMPGQADATATFTMTYQ